MLGELKKAVWTCDRPVPEPQVNGWLPCSLRKRSSPGPGAPHLRCGADGVPESVPGCGFCARHGQGQYA